MPNITVNTGEDKLEEVDDTRAIVAVTEIFENNMRTETSGLKLGSVAK